MQELEIPKIQIFSGIIKPENFQILKQKHTCFLRQGTNVNCRTAQLFWITGTIKHVPSLDQKIISYFSKKVIHFIHIK